MRCFIHLGVEAVSVCKKCGKAMCVNCSAYSGHSGICPECRKFEFERECDGLRTQINKNKSMANLSMVLAVIFAIAAVLAAIFISAIGLALLLGTAIGVLRFVVLNNRCKPLNDRLNYLTGEIIKLEDALHKGSSIL